MACAGGGRAFIVDEEGAGVGVEAGLRVDPLALVIAGAELDGGNDE